MIFGLPPLVVRELTFVPVLQPTYFGSTLPLPREVDYAADSAIIEVAPSAPVSEAAVKQVQSPVAELLTTKEDDVEVGREEATVTTDSLPQVRPRFRDLWEQITRSFTTDPPRSLMFSSQPQDPTPFSPLVVAERIASEAQPSPATGESACLAPYSESCPDLAYLAQPLRFRSRTHQE